MAHSLGIDFLAHTAVVHVFIILLNLDAVCQRPRLGTVAGLVVGQRRCKIIECLVVAVNSHCETADGFLGLVHKQLLGAGIGSQCRDSNKYNEYLLHNLRSLKIGCKISHFLPCVQHIAPIGKPIASVGKVPAARYRYELLLFSDFATP